MNELQYILDLIKDDELIKNCIGKNIYFYQVSEKAKKSDGLVIISPVYDEPSTYVSNKYLSETFTVQIDVETYKDELTRKITKRIRYILKQNDMHQMSSQLTDYFKATKRYVRSRRYQGVPKNKYFKGERVE